MRWYTAHAYTPNEAALYGGGDHAVLLEDFESGRIRRKKGDVLCRPSRRFLNILGVEKGRVVTCKRCKALLSRFGEPLASREDVRPPAPVVEAPVQSVGAHPEWELAEMLSHIFRGRLE